MKTTQAEREALAQALLKITRGEIREDDSYECGLAFEKGGCLCDVEDELREFFVASYRIVPRLLDQCAALEAENHQLRAIAEAAQVFIGVHDSQEDDEFTWEHHHDKAIDNLRAALAPRPEPKP